METGNDVIVTHHVPHDHESVQEDVYDVRSGRLKSHDLHSL